MYVVAVDDNGEERNFLATHVEIAESTCVAVINGLRTIIPLLDLIDVVPINEVSATGDVDACSAFSPRQGRLC